MACGGANGARVRWCVRRCEGATVHDRTSHFRTHDHTAAQIALSHLSLRCRQVFDSWRAEVRMVRGCGGASDGAKVRRCTIARRTFGRTIAPPHKSHYRTYRCAVVKCLTHGVRRCEWCEGAVVRPTVRRCDGARSHVALSDARSHRRTNRTIALIAAL